jgi:outer membrane protein assembly factor BamB
MMPDPFDVYLSSPTAWKNAIFVGSGDGNVYSLDAATGRERWRFHTGDVVHASPAVEQDTVFIGSWDRYMYALDAATGHERWRFVTGADRVIHNQVGIQSSAVVDHGSVYFGCRDSHLYAVDAHTGRLRWSFPTHGSWVVSSPAVGNGTVYFATSDSSLVYALHTSNGHVLFSRSFHGWPFFSSPAIAGGMLYLGSWSGTLAALNRSTGAVVWSFQTDGAKHNVAGLTKADGSPNYEAAYRSAFYDDIVVGFNKMMSVGSILSSPVVADGTVFFGSTDGNVYALH